MTNLMNQVKFFFSSLIAAWPLTLIVAIVGMCAFAEPSEAVQEACSKQRSVSYHECVVELTK